MKIRPVRQGGLDGLCGIYAIINALRLVLHHNRRIRGKDYEGLFECLVFRAHRLIPRSIPTVEGIDTPQLVQLLVEARRYCRDELEVEVGVSRPLSKGPRVGIAKSISLLRNVLESPATALLVGFGGLEHWSVVKAVTDHHLILHDSSGRKYLPTRRCRMSHEPGGLGKPITIMRGATFALHRL